MLPEQEGSRPFTSLVSSKDFTQLTHAYGMEKRAREGKKVSDGGLEKTMLQQFKPRENQIIEQMNSDVTGEASLEPLDQTTAEEIDLLTSWSSEINEHIIVTDDKLSKKRKDPFEGMSLHCHYWFKS